MVSDIRLQRRGERILDAIVTKNSLLLRAIGGGRAGEIAAGPYPDSTDVTFQYLRTTTAGRCPARALASSDDAADHNARRQFFRVLPGKV